VVYTFRNFILSFVMARHSPVGQDPFIIWTSRTQNDAPSSVELLWRSDRPIAKTSTCTTHNTQKETSMPPAGFKHPIPARVRPKTYALDRATTGTGPSINITRFIKSMIIRLVGHTARTGDDNFIIRCRQVAEREGSLKTNV